MIEKLIHHYLRVPYTLHIYRQSKVAKARATLVFLHGIGNSGRTWDEVSEKLPEDVNIVIIDLLGFGDSPQPDWAIYDAKNQARSIAKTLINIGVFGKIVMVGHSMGSLIAVEFAKRYPHSVSSLILCSPPIYNLDKTDHKPLFLERDHRLRLLYELVLKKPEGIIAVSSLAKRAKLLNPSFDVKALNIDAYASALRANILNQSTAHDIVRLKQPVHIIYGTLDPFVIGDNLEEVVAESSNISVEKFIGGHEILGGYVKRIVRMIDKHLGTQAV
jgi:pimeloyl-ACP methyl ester carboxylesterase